MVSFKFKTERQTRFRFRRLSSISFTMAGPTTDYGYTSFGVPARRDM